MRSVFAFALALCACTVTRDPDVGVDVRTDAPVAAEADCTNGDDDDGDAATDCEDVDCRLEPTCLRDTGFPSCTGVSATAEERVAPLDVVFVVDGSGSMDQEAAIVQDGLNAFAAAIASSGIDDYHVVMLTRAGWVTVPAPLGTDPEHYLFVDELVDSDQGFTDTVARYGDYAGFLRPAAALHFVIVSDDESTAMTDVEFLAAMGALAGRPFVVHAIASPEDPESSTGACVGPYGMAEAVGVHYRAAADATGGLFESICTSSWAPIFDRLTAAVAVVRTIPCTFVIPPPPDGATFDRARVNVRHVPTGGAATTFPRSDGCAARGGWEYDAPDAPTEVRLCPDACAEVSADTAGRLDVEFGCETILF